MRMKFIRNGHTQRRELVVASQRSETLDKKSAEKLADDPSALLLGFTYEKQRGSGNVVLHYDVEGLWSLRTYLSKRALSVDELMGLLEATERVLDICAEVRLKSEGLLFDPEYIFVDAQCCPHFALIVLDDVPFQARNSPLMLLRAVTAEHVRYDTPDATGLARRVSDLVIDLEDVFSVNKFRRFLEDERRQGDTSVPHARQSVVEPGTSSVWATAGGGTQGTTSMESGSFFWSPLAGMANETDSQPAVQDVRNATSAPEQPKSTAAPHTVPVKEEIPQPVVTQAPQSGESSGGHSSGILSSGRVTQLENDARKASPVASRPASTSGAQTASAGELSLVRLATGEHYALPLGQQVQAGRGSSCDIRLLGNRKLSRVHVALTNTGQMVMVSDMGAVNGVFVDGRRLGPMQSVLVRAGQRIQLADEDFAVTSS